MTIPRIRPVVFREPSSGAIVTTEMKPAVPGLRIDNNESLATGHPRRTSRQLSPRLVAIAAILIALALVAGVIWILM